MNIRDISDEELAQIISNYLKEMREKDKKPTYVNRHITYVDQRKKNIRLVVSNK